MRCTHSCRAGDRKSTRKREHPPNHKPSHSASRLRDSASASASALCRCLCLGPLPLCPESRNWSVSSPMKLHPHIQPARRRLLLEPDVVTSLFSLLSLVITLPPPLFIDSASSSSFSWSLLHFILLDASLRLLRIDSHSHHWR